MSADVSVIVAAYNVEPYIDYAIRSALNQDVTVEVIVINDASTDRTAEVVAAIQDPRVRLINLEKNQGASFARNLGFENITAPWTAILDGDDAMLPGRLKKCLRLAAETKADIVVDNVEVRREDDGAIYTMFPPDWFSRLGVIDLACFIKNNCSFVGFRTLGHVKPIFSSAFLREHDLRYDPKIRIIEDYYLLAEALARGARCVAESSIGYSYTMRKGSISHRLTSSDIGYFMTVDAEFLTHHTLSPAAAAAQKLRNRSFVEAFSYTSLVEAIKRRDIGAALHLIVSDPRAALNLWRPVEARVRRARVAINNRCFS